MRPMVSPRAYWLLLLGALASCTAPTASKPVADNAEIKSIFDADQADRKVNVTTIDWSKVTPRDAERRERAFELIAANQLRTGTDFYRASYVFQHGDSSDDILLAHILAVTSLSKGNMEARFATAMTLDRYLDKIGRPQVFGTQFHYPRLNDPGNMTQEPYNSKLISDALRAANCVDPVAVQRKAMESIKNGTDPESPAVCGPTAEH